jgi:hypothetical protein
MRYYVRFIDKIIAVIVLCRMAASKQVTVEWYGRCKGIGDNGIDVNLSVVDKVVMANLRYGGSKAMPCYDELRFPESFRYNGPDLL